VRCAAESSRSRRDRRALERGLGALAEGRLERLVRSLGASRTCLRSCRLPVSTELHSCYGCSQRGTGRKGQGRRTAGLRPILRKRHGNAGRFAQSSGTSRPMICISRSALPAVTGPARSL
jgi:hypothetical protein